ncbi:transposase [Pseudomonas congelans]|uniref:IS66 family transposase n=1 Tax=Pseudomonas congelans TaxID=200452 RepID=UPI001F4750EE|nr:transposase [Pseudomonas congelans]MCF5167315.1 transposase [Pseudomonas congelans]
MPATGRNPISVAISNGNVTSKWLPLTEMSHARRKFLDLHATNKSKLAEQALHSIGGLYEIERQPREMTDEHRWRIRQEKSGTHYRRTTYLDYGPARSWAEGSAISKSLDYSRRR